MLLQHDIIGQQMELLIDISHQESVVGKWNGRPLSVTGEKKEGPSTSTQEGL